MTALQTPPQATSTLHDLRSTKDRSAALFILQAFIWLLAVIPARLVFRPIGYFGSPASMVGLLAMSLWACGAVRPDLLVRKVVAVRVAVVVFWLPTLISFAVLHLNSVPSDEVNAADRWLLFGLVWSGVALLAAEGLRSRDEVMRLLRMVVAAGSFSAAVALMQSRLNFDLTKYMQKLPLLYTDGELAAVLSRAGLNRPAGTATHPIEFGCVLCMVLGFALGAGVLRQGLGRQAPLVSPLPDRCGDPHGSVQIGDPRRGDRADFLAGQGDEAAAPSDAAGLYVRWRRRLPHLAGTDRHVEELLRQRHQR